MWSLGGHARDERLACGTWDVRGQPLGIIRRIEHSRREQLRGCISERGRIERGDVECRDIDELSRIVRERVVGRQLDAGGDLEWERWRLGDERGSEHGRVRLDEQRVAVAGPGLVDHAHGREPGVHVRRADDHRQQHQSADGP